MYILVNAVLKLKGKNQRFQNVDLTDVYLQTLFDRYHKGYITLSNSALSGLIYVDIQQLKQMANLSYSNVKIPTWLARQGNRSIVGGSQEPTIKINRISFSDAVQAGCVLSRVHPTDIKQINSYAISDLTDLHIVKTQQAKPYLQNYTLTTVSGRCHLNIPTSQGILVKGAGDTLDVSKDPHVGLISFEQLGIVNQEVLNTAQILPQEQPLYKGFYYDLKTDISQSTVFISILGKLFYPDKITTSITDNGVIRINLQTIDLLRLVTESVGVLNLDSLGLNLEDYMIHGVVQGKLVDNDLILRILQHAQTFLIVVGVKGIQVDHLPMGQTGLVGVYELTTARTLPYIDDWGNIKAYWTMVYQGQFVDIHRFYVKPELYTQPADQGGGFIDSDVVTRAMVQVEQIPELHTGYQLDIYTENLI